MQILNQLTYINKSSLALGFFDGLHTGHRVVLKNTINLAKKHKTNSTVIIFCKHPLNFLTGKNVEQILTLEEKLEMFEKIGIDNVVLLDFNEFSNIKAIDYIEKVLIKYYSPIAITTGFNHHFGYNAEGNSELLRRLGTKYGYKYFEIPPYTINGNIVSCSVIRSMLKLGNFYEANKLLGYNFFVRSNVVKGEKIASKLGFPSANINYPDNKIKIPFGVYFVKVKHMNNVYKGILNYGFAPTLDNETKLKTEVHILNFNKEIYGQNIEIAFITKIRNQMKFDNIEKLKTQIIRDIAFADIYDRFINTHISFPNKSF